MDASLDNSNNPFSNSNGATTGDSILSQKSDGLLLNLTDNFKANGDDFFATTDKSNKRLMSEFDGDADLGPETDVDAVDDNSPEAMPWPASRALLDAVGVDYLEPFAKRKPTNEFDLQTQQGGDLDGDAVRDVRDETPTPPADVVHDVSGLVENAVESDSEDEWNYFKGEDANKENISPSQPEKEVADNSEEDDDDDNMSQLNPNAAEFVPVSPTRSNPSPIRVSLLNDEVISQSPMRPTQNELDILLPNRKDFECEIKSRPSEVEAYSNGHDSSDSEHVTTPPIENILNGKSIDEIPEFLPSGTPTKTASISDEFHFGPNAAPFTPVKLLDQSEALSTMAVFGDESTINEVTFIDNQTSQDVSDFLSTSDKEQDPMSMSFYQDKADKNESTNPFEIELNNVHVLPEDLNDFLGELDETMSDLPEHSPLKGVEKVANNDDAIQITDLDKPLEEKELESPIVEDHSELSAKSPEPLVEQEFVDDMLSGIKELPKSPEPVLQEEQITNIIEQLSVAAAEQTHEHTFVLDLDTSSLREVPRDVPQSPIAEETSEISEASAVSEEIQAVEAALQCDNLESKSPEPEIAILLPEAEKEIDFVVPPQEEPLICPAKPEEEPLENLLAKSPEPEMKSPTPIVCPKLDTSDKDLEDSFVMVSDQLPTLQLENNVNFAQEISNAIQETEAAPTPDLVCGDIPPTEIEKVESFLPDVVSPAEPTNPLEALGGILDLNHPLAKCVYPLPNQFVNDDNVIDIQTDNISPEFPEEAIVSPSEESKQSDEVPTAPLVEEVPVVTTAIIEDVKSVVEEVKPEVVVVEKKMKAKSANAVGARKPTPSPKAPVKTTTLNKTTATKVGATAAPAKPKLAAPPTTKPPATKLSPRPRTAPLASTRSLADKKTNGDVKTSARTTTLTATRKPTETKTATTTRLAATRTSPTKPATARPATAPRAAAPAPKPRVPLARPASATTATRSAPASRPIASTLSKTTTTTTTKTTTLPKTTTSTLSSRTAAAAKPRPPTTTSAPLKPRVPLTKTLSKTTPDADKQSKESANKLMASKTTTARTLNSARSPAAATTMRKATEAKNLISRTAKTTTNSTTTKTAIGKKPAEITRAKTTKTTKIEKPKENGVSAVVTEEISIVNNVVNNAVNESEADLLKDNSPIDNKLLVDNLLIETSKVD